MPGVLGVAKRVAFCEFLGGVAMNTARVAGVAGRVALAALPATLATPATPWRHL